MSTTLHSFMDIFDTVFSDDGTDVQLKRISIPIIQRDYAQGREDPEIDRVRARFLDALYKAVTEQPITLDFVYGDIDEEGVMTPLDGQQRLTTLFLLHWYAAKKEMISEDAWRFLRNFSYETRYSARYFCSELVEFTPSFERSLKEDIINQPWFPLDWKKDPTISSMLIMLDDIDEKFKDIAGLWDSLKDNAITFYFLPIKDMGLTDELYIKMNSRGKPLTLFEHFKAELEKEMTAIDPITAHRIISKFDREWMDLLWMYRDGGYGNEDDDTTDDEFLHYVQFVCDVICFHNGESPQSRSNDIFDLIHLYFSSDNEDALYNMQTLENYFDCWRNIDGFNNPAEFFDAYMTEEIHEPGKISIDPRYSIDVFKDCLHDYAELTGRKKVFPLNRFVLLYAVIVYLQNPDKITKSEFRRRIRIVNNLLQNSEDEVTDRIERNRMPAVLEQTVSIMLKGVIDDSIDANFNVNQLNEEKEKSLYLEQHPEQEDVLYRLEDDELLHGQISIVGLEHLDLTDKFIELFDCDWDKVDCALMSVGDYKQQEMRTWRYQVGSSSQLIAWDELFHKSRNKGFENTGRILVKLLEGLDSVNDESLENIIMKYIEECEDSNHFPWRYYYVKYHEFRPGRYGKLATYGNVDSEYMFAVLQTRSKWSENSYLPYLKAADGKRIDRDDYGRSLDYGDCYIQCSWNSFIVRNNSDEEIDIVIIEQDDGVDIEDRIIKLREYISKNLVV